MRTRKILRHPKYGGRSCDGALAELKAPRRQNRGIFSGAAVRKTSVIVGELSVLHWQFSEGVDADEEIFGCFQFLNLGKFYDYRGWIRFVHIAMDCRMTHPTSIIV